MRHYDETKECGTFAAVALSALAVFWLAVSCFGCASAPQWPTEVPPKPGRPEHVDKSVVSTMGARLAVARASIVKVKPEGAVMMTEMPLLQTNTFKIVYPFNPAGRMWALESSYDTVNWKPRTNYFLAGTNVGVFVSNGIPEEVFRVRLY